MSDPAAPLAVDAIAPEGTAAGATDGMATAPATDPAAPAVSRRHQVRVKLAGFLHWFVLRILAVALFVGGVALGYNAYLNSQPAPVAAIDPAVADVPAPPVVQELVGALRANDEAGLRSVVPAEPYQLLIAEMDRWEFQDLTDVKVLSTALDGPRTATELILSGTSTAGNPVAINLVVHTSDGRISSFR